MRVRGKQFEVVGQSKLLRMWWSDGQFALVQAGDGLTVTRDGAEATLLLSFRIPVALPLEEGPFRLEMKADDADRLILSLKRDGVESATAELRAEECDVDAVEEWFRATDWLLRGAWRILREQKGWV